MINRDFLSVSAWLGSRDEKTKVGVLTDILIVFAPLLILGSLGEWIGDSTVPGALLINLAYILSVGLATIVLGSRGSGWRKIGLARPGSWPKTVLLGAGAAAGAIAASVLFQIVVQLIPALEIAPRDQSSYDAVVGNLPLLILYLAAAWTIVTFGEEMIFRAFLTNSLAGFFPGKKGQWALALIGSSLLFGLAHFSWGLAGVLETTVIGFVLGAAYLLSGRNLWATIIAHGLLNTMSFILIFSGLA